MNTDSWVKRARALAWFGLCYNVLEAALSIGFGARDRSLSLLGFGCDSLIEAAAAALILWRFQSVVKGLEDEREEAAQKWISVLLLGLAAYLLISAGMRVIQGQGPVEGGAGIWISLVSLGVMAWLYRAKVACATALNSKALKADAFCSLSCMWLSGLLLLGSALFVGTHLFWFDALTTLAMAVLIIREAAEEYDESHGS